MDDDGDLDETGLGEDVPVPGETEAEKRKRRQERHRTLERKRREKTQGLLNAIQAEIEQQTGQRQPGAANFTLNKALNHVVNHVKKLKEVQSREETGSDKVTKFSHPAGHTDSAAEDFELVRAAVLGCDTPIVFVCMDGGIIESNVAFEELLGYASEELKGHTFYMHSVPEDMANLMSAVCNLITEQSTQETKTVRLIHRDGSYIQATLYLCSGRFAEKTYIVVYVTEHNGGKPAGSVDTPPNANFIAPPPQQQQLGWQDPSAPPSHQHSVPDIKPSPQAWGAPPGGPPHPAQNPPMGHAPGNARATPPSAGANGHAPMRSGPGGPLQGQMPGAPPPMYGHGGPQMQGQDPWGGGPPPHAHGLPRQQLPAHHGQGPPPPQQHPPPPHDMYYQHPQQPQHAQHAQQSPRYTAGPPQQGGYPPAQHQHMGPPPGYAQAPGYPHPHQPSHPQSYQDAYGQPPPHAHEQALYGQQSGQPYYSPQPSPGHQAPPRTDRKSVV